MHNIKKRLNLPEQSEFNEFSPLISGFATSCFYILGLGMFAQPNVTVYPWLWLLVFPILLVSLFLQVFSTRLLFIRSFQTVVFLIIAITFTILLWFVLDHDSSLITRTLLTCVIIIAIGGSVTTIFLTIFPNEDLELNPQGRFGFFNPRQGVVILQPSSTSKNVKLSRETNHTTKSLLAKLSPLITGLAMFVVQVSSQSGLTIITAIVVFAGAVLAATGFVRFFRHSLAIMAWEKQNNRPILLQVR